MSDREETPEEKLKKLAEREGGKVITDSQYGRVVHIHAFHSITADGTHIYEWP